MVELYLLNEPEKANNARDRFYRNGSVETLMHLANLLGIDLAGEVSKAK